MGIDNPAQQLLRGGVCHGLQNLRVSLRHTPPISPGVVIGYLVLCAEASDPVRVDDGPSFVRAEMGSSGWIAEEIQSRFVGRIQVSFRDSTRNSMKAGGFLLFGIGFRRLGSVARSRQPAS
jgi:hypothetical protein